MERDGRADAAREIELLVRSRYPLIVVDTLEEERLEALLSRTAARLDLPLFTWSRTRGLVREGLERGVYDTSDPLKLLAHIMAAGTAGLYLLADFHPWLSDPLTARTFRETTSAFTSGDRALILSGHGIDLPPEISAAAVRWKLSLPDTAAIRAELASTVRQLHEELDVTIRLSAADADALSHNLSGLTLEEIRRALRRAALEDRSLDRSDFESLLAAKREAVGRTGLLEWYAADSLREPVGGMRRLRDWLDKRKGAFEESARAFGLEPPRGVLLVGVQGCGKSLLARTVALSWRLPLVRLDPSALYDKYIGETEKNLRRALETVDAMAPVVLWIDEIEKGLATASSDSDGGLSKRLLGSFLTWFQERTPGVFVVATANDVAALPPELLRKGRFDEIFFVDLPDHEERAEILALHIEDRGRDPESFDLDALAGGSEGFSGAELEQAIVAAMYTTYSEERDLDSEAIAAEIARTVPLSVTMAEKVAGLREWARGRTVPAA